MNQRIVIVAKTLVSALGHGIAKNFQALMHKQTGLRKLEFDGSKLNGWIGIVDGLEEQHLPGRFSDYDCRNNRLAMMALEQDTFTDELARAKNQYGPDRIAIFVGTSTSGIHQTEQAYRHREPDTGQLPSTFHYRATHSQSSLSEFVQKYTGLQGPAMVISTACSSSAKVFASAARALDQGICDAALVGGADSLCLTTLCGFSSLGLASSKPCRPWDKDRDGINIGEASGFVLLENARSDDDRVALIGYGESSDAYHISTPHPEGLGAYLSMKKALQMADIDPTQVDYINLHGTGTPANDRSEDTAIVRLFGQVCASSTKGWTGHTLGAAGILESIFSVMMIERGFLPCSLNTETVDPKLTSTVLMQNRRQRVQRVLSNSFGFGGSNCSLLFGSVS